jgi:membrane protease subunit HflC
VLVADATAKSEQMRGEGDATRNRIFAEAYGKDVDFFSFYRAMQAYETGLRHNDTRMLLKPDSEFFRYFGDPSGKLRPATPASPAPGGAAPSAGGPAASAQPAPAAPAPTPSTNAQR